MRTPCKSPRQLVRPGFILSLAVVLGLSIILANLYPAGSHRPKLLRVAGNLMRIDIAKKMWASDHAATNGTVVTEADLMQYLKVAGRTGLVTTIDSEVYRVNAIGTPPEAQLQKPLEARFPKGTLVRWDTNAGPQILLPNPQGGTNVWQPPYSDGGKSH